MSGGLVSFDTYTFTFLQDFATNFADGVLHTVRLPGMDGGFNLDGSDAPPAPVGSVRMGFYLVSETRAGLDDLRDAVRGLQYKGLKRLVYQPTDDTDAQRWAWARAQSIQMGEQKQAQTDFWQPVSITFECPEAVWFVDAYMPTWLIGDTDVELGDVGLEIGDGAYAIAA